MILSYDYSKSLLLINKNLTKEIFIEEAGVQDGYSLEVFSRIYYSLTSELIDLDEEFKKFYSFEYNSMENYLYRKYNLKEEYIVKLMEERKKNPDCLLYRKDDNSYGDYGITQFTYSETMYGRIIEILMLKKVTK